MNVVIENPLSRGQETEVVLEEWASSIMKLVTEQYAVHDEQLRGMLGPEAYVDEMALLFVDFSHARWFIDMAVRMNGVTLFNSARDVVRTRPVRSEYEVHYWFLSAPEGHSSPERPWRIEVMVPHSGSPLHDSFLRDMRRGGQDSGLVHASFKCTDEEAYANAVVALGKNGYEAAQRCESTYGKFSYWYPLDLNDTEPATALKPRVNLRDQEGDDE